MTAPANDLVRYSIESGVAVLELDDAAHRNALSRAMSGAIARAVNSAIDSGARAIVLTATPPVFCSGGSLDDLLDRETPLQDSYEGFLAVAECPVPTICAISGPAIGAGVNLVLACDVVLCTPEARFDPRFLDVGIHPGGGHLFRLMKRVGPQGAAALVIFGDTLTGDEAVVAGLAWKCVGSEALTDTAMRLAQRAAERPAELVRRTKQSLRTTEQLTDVKQAEALELDAQRWSMEQPEFESRVKAIQQRIRARTS
jgi:enoyl-CoA hydratase